MFHLLRKILDWLFPLTCVCCEQEDCAVCEDCWLGVETRIIQECPYCRRESLRGKTCDDCQEKGAGALDGLICLWNYHKGSPLARLLYYYKYEAMMEYGAELQRRFAEEAGWHLIMNEFDLITWVPLAVKKWRKRGFNQSEQLAGVLKGNFCEAVNILQKIRETHSQMSLNRMERLKNLEGAFVVRPELLEKLKGRRVLVVDDIATTLSTLEEVARALKSAGCSKVIGLVAARQKD